METTAERSESPDTEPSHRKYFKLENHVDKLIGVLYTQWLEGALCDFQLHTSNGSLPVHSCVLSAFCPRIAEVIKSNNERDNSPRRKTTRTKKLVIHSFDIMFDYDIVKCVVEALYLGVMSIDTGNLDAALRVAEWLGIPDLVNIESQDEPSSVPCSKKSSKSSAKKRSSSSHRATLHSSDASSQLNDSLDYPEVIFLPDNQYGIEGHALLDNLKVVCERVEQVSLLSGDTLRGIAKFENEQEDTQTLNTPDTAVCLDEIIEQPAKKRKKYKKKKHLQDGQKNQNTNDAHSGAKVEQTSGNSNKKGSALSTSNESGVSEKQMDAVNVVVQLGNGELESTQVKVKEEIADDSYLDLVSKVPGGTDTVSQDQVQSGNLKLQCDRCRDVFTDLEKYRQHVNDHPIFSCELCFCDFYKRSLYVRHVHKAHLKHHHLVCSHCEFRSHSSSDLKVHCWKEHQNSKPFCCLFEGCSFKTGKYRSLTRHFKIHEAPSHLCGNCGKSFTTSHLLCSHKYTCLNAKTFLCEFCGKKFNRQDGMQHHRKIVHLGEKPFKCKICPCSFTHRSNLSRHIRIHDNTFPYVCSDCGKSFRHSNSFKLHMTKSHNKKVSEAVNSPLSSCILNRKNKNAKKVESISTDQENGNGSEQISSDIPLISTDTLQQPNNRSSVSFIKKKMLNLFSKSDPYPSQSSVSVSDSVPQVVPSTTNSIADSIHQHTVSSVSISNTDSTQHTAPSTSNSSTHLLSSTSEFRSQVATRTQSVTTTTAPVIPTHTANDVVSEQETSTSATIIAERNSPTAVQVENMEHILSVDFTSIQEVVVPASGSFSPSDDSSAIIQLL